MSLENVSRAQAMRALGLSTFAFTICFAVWLLFSIIGVPLKKEYGWTETQFGWLVATPVLTGSLSRIFLGILTEKLGGRVVFPAQMITTAIAVWFLTTATTYQGFILAALGLGLAGGSFIIGIAYTSRWFEKKHQGTALGIFGAGNAGAALTNFGAPHLVAAYGWQTTVHIYAIVLGITGVLFLLLAQTDPVIRSIKAGTHKHLTLAEQLAPLKNIQVWRFATYYFFVFGAFVAFASFLPRYYVGAYGVSLVAAGTFAGLYSLPGSVFRALGGWLSDVYGARVIMYLTFIISLIFLFIMSYPETNYEIMGKNDTPIQFSFGVSLTAFVSMTVVLGFMMSLGKAAVYKHIPVYYPEHVGSVGGLVALIGGLGGFFLPIIFGKLLDATNVWTTPFMFTFVLVLIMTIWMHVSIRRMEIKKNPELAEPQDLPELSETK